MTAWRFNSQAALAYAAALARPRRVGSGEDERVAAEIEERLRQWGYRVERQPFTFSTAPQAFLTGMVLGGMLLIIAILLLHDRLPVVGDLAALVLLTLFIAFMPLSRVVQGRAWRGENLARNDLGERVIPNAVRNLAWLGTLRRRSEMSRNALSAKRGRARRKRLGMTCLIERHATTNLIAHLPLPDRSDLPHLFLVAHYDSKSQWMPLTTRIVLFMLLVLFGLLLIGLTLFQSSSALYLPIGLLALAAGAPLLFLDVGNASPGAIDNASGVGLVLHLAEVLAQQEAWRNRLRVTILIPSAEEWTLMGSVAYVGAHERALRQQAGQGGLSILNFDGIGVDGNLYYVGNSRRAGDSATISLLAQVQAACRELNLPLKRFGFIGALFDHISFAQRGFDAISLVAVNAASRSVHTPADSIDQLHVRGFDQAGRVALRVIERIS